MRGESGGCPTLAAAAAVESAATTPAETAVPAPVDESAAATASKATASVATDTASPTAAAAPTQTPAPTVTGDPQAWTTLPVLPHLSPRAQEILAQGLAKGRNPRAFSKIGDCESQASWFLSDFDLRPKVYSLGSYDAELQPVIDYYSGSYKRLSLAAKPGFSAASLLAPIWADKKICQKNESPLACEYRVNKPLVAFIMLGSNDASNPKTFEGHMRKIIEYSLAQGVLPVLGTKADNVEGGPFHQRHHRPPGPRIRPAAVELLVRRPGIARQGPAGGRSPSDLRPDALRHPGQYEKGLARAQPECPANLESDEGSK